MLRASGILHTALDIQLQAASTALPTVASTQLIPPTIVSQTGGVSYDNGTGIFTSLINGNYVTNIMLNVNVAAARSFYFYTTINTGSGFVNNRYSARQVNLTSPTDGQIIFTSTNFFPVGVQFKFYFWCSGTGTMDSQDLPGTTPGTVTVAAQRILITGT